MSVEFKFAIGDIVCLKLDPNVRGMIIEHRSITDATGRMQAYVVRFVKAQRSHPMLTWLSKGDGDDSAIVGTALLSEIELESPQSANPAST